MVLTGARIVADMIRVRPPMKLRHLTTIVRLATAVLALLAHRCVPPVAVPPLAIAAERADAPTITVLVPARDEAHRIGPLLQAVCGAPGVHEVVVVDDQSSDGTAGIARSSGARVVDGAPLPPGWAGKAWALQQGLLAATGEWIVALDADTRPSPHLARSLVGRAMQDGLDIVTVAGRFECPTAGVQWLHPAMLTTLVYRFGPPGLLRRCVGRPPSRERAVHGRATTRPHRGRRIRSGGGQVVEDVALVRHLAAQGWNVAMLDGPELLTTRMYETGPDAFRGWGRSLALPGVEPRHRQIIDLAVVLLAQALPIPRLLARRGDVLDVALAAMRLGTLAGTRSAYLRRGVPYWMSPAADLVAAAALAKNILNPNQPWKSRPPARRGAVAKRRPMKVIRQPVAAVR